MSKDNKTILSKTVVLCQTFYHAVKKRPNKIKVNPMFNYTFDNPHQGTHRQQYKYTNKTVVLYVHVSMIVEEPTFLCLSDGTASGSDCLE